MVVVMLLQHVIYSLGLGENNNLINRFLYFLHSFSPLALSLFNKNDEPLLCYLNEDGMSIEPEWYCPIIPTVLVNGASGVGTGYSTDIPCL